MGGHCKSFFKSVARVHGRLDVGVVVRARLWDPWVKLLAFAGIKNNAWHVDNRFHELENWSIEQMNESPFLNMCILYIYNIHKL